MFNFAKAEAIKLIPATLERLMDMYDGTDGVTLSADAEKMQTLITEAQSGIAWSYVAMWVESTTAEYILLSDFAHFAPRTRPFAQQNGCGPDDQNICVNVLHIAGANGGELPVYGPIQSTIFYNHPINGLVEALLHEALHYVVDTSVIEPASVGQGYLEHRIIFDVLGTSDITYMIQ